MSRFALTLEFDGGPFMGLQRQDHGPSVQEAVERAALEVTGETATMHSAGRTDSGVHALAMVSHVDIEKEITPFRLMEALNARLRPAPIAVVNCEPKPDDWHARFSCIGRKYEYRIRNRRAPLTLERGRAWHVTRTLDHAAFRYRTQSRAKYTSSATSVPRWRKTSKASEPMSSSSSQPKIHGASSRCAEELTGMNSVSPWSRPMTAAWRTTSKRA